MTRIGGAHQPVVLVLRALGLGDLLTGLPALRGLRRAYPRHRLVLGAPRSLAPIVRLAGGIDELLATDGLGALEWDRDAPDLAVNLHGRGPQSIADLLATKPKDLITHRHPRYRQVDGLVWRRNLHEVDRWCRLVEWAGIPADRRDLALSTSPGRRDETVADETVAVVHPGAAAPARRWPPDRFATVAAHLRARGMRVVITGSAAEHALAERVATDAGLGSEAVLAGLHDLGALAEVVAQARLVVCGDTGMGHLATAFDTPSVLLFGPTPPRLWGPPTSPAHRVLWAGDVGDPHAAEPDPGLLLITAQRVIDAVDEQLDRASPGREFSDAH